MDHTEQCGPVPVKDRDGLRMGASAVLSVLFLIWVLAVDFPSFVPLLPSAFPTSLSSYLWPVTVCDEYEIGFPAAPLPLGFWGEVWKAGEAWKLPWNTCGGGSGQWEREQKTDNVSLFSRIPFFFQTSGYEEKWGEKRVRDKGIGLTLFKLHLVPDEHIHSPGS